MKVVTAHMRDPRTARDAVRRIFLIRFDSVDIRPQRSRPSGSAAGEHRADAGIQSAVCNIDSRELFQRLPDQLCRIVFLP